MFGITIQLTQTRPIRIEGVEFKDCETFLSNDASTALTAPEEGAGRASSRARLGRALVAREAFQTGDLVLIDQPFLVVSNPDGLERDWARWVRRWDCYFELMKLGQQGHPELLEAFDAMDDGGEDVVESLKEDASDTLQLMWRSGPAGAIPEAQKERDRRKVARGFARWQTNQHAFPPAGEGEKQRRALYWLAPTHAWVRYGARSSDVGVDA
eukprot:g28039.t1